MQIRMTMNHSHQHNHIDYVELPASNGATLLDCKRFYEGVFGWRYQDYGPEYADTQTSGLTSGISVDEARTTRPLPVIFSNDLEASRGQVLAAGGQLTKDIFSFPGGRRFQFKDPAGNELAVWSDRLAQ
jgi:predicted enzyme related to lactoylglutathione lyase